MDSIISNSTEMIPSVHSPHTSLSSYNLNFKTVFLIILLILACCFLSAGYNFEINNLFNLNSLSFWACVILILFTFYVLYEFFKSDTCEDINKSGWDRLKTSANRGRSYVGQKGTNAMLSMGNTLSNASQRITSPTANFVSDYINKMGQKHLPQKYQNPNYTQQNNLAPNPNQNPNSYYNSNVI